MTYEIMQPEAIGLNANKLVLGKHSGRHALRDRLRDLGYDLSDEELKIVFTKFKELADKKKHVVDEDLEVVVTEGILRTTEYFKLEYLHVAAGTSVMPMASVELTINDRKVRGADWGNGPIDSGTGLPENRITALKTARKALGGLPGAASPSFTRLYPGGHRSGLHRGESSVSTVHS
jgi:hypothetical protein